MCNMAAVLTLTFFASIFMYVKVALQKNSWPRNSFFLVSSKLLLSSSRPGSKTNFVVAKLYVHLYAAVVLGCVDDRIKNITQKCIKLPIQYHEFMAVANVCYHMRIPVANEKTCYQNTTNFGPFNV